MEKLREPTGLWWCSTTTASPEASPGNMDVPSTQRSTRAAGPLSSIRLLTNIVSPSLHVLSTQVLWRVTNRLWNINTSRNFTRRIYRCAVRHRCRLGSSRRCAMGRSKIRTFGGIAGDGHFVLGCCFFGFVRSSCVLAVLWRSDQRDGGHYSNHDLRECQGEEVPFASFLDIAYWLQHCRSFRPRWVVKI